MGKYYAVKKGRKSGIYTSWAECEAQVKGYSGAIFKKFSTYEEAENFIYGDEEILETKDTSSLKENEIIAYVDGSFSQSTSYYSYGIVIFTRDGKEVYKDKENNEDLVAMRNVAGEIRGAMKAMELALKKNKDTLYLYYDYMGIEKWATLEWQAKKSGTKEYRDYYNFIKNKLKVVFIKVEAHSGEKYNEEADQLAKSALGIKG